LRADDRIEITTASIAYYRAPDADMERIRIGLG
jgi:hypothetical protein